ncbi:MAG: hypothetical protein HRU14_05085 [Planctomycetes bacterium]|jgi:hypothetical protein|nr:hypothetical protein [Planctomycetota bacterium]
MVRLYASEASRKLSVIFEEKAARSEAGKGAECVPVVDETFDEAARERLDSLFS